MRTISHTAKFKKDYKREMKSHIIRLDTKLKAALNLLANDKPLPKNYYDHALSGNWSDHRDCHIKPDLVLIYRKPDAKSLQLVRLGSHSELGL